MAERRMFARKIVDSDTFLDMPHSTQNLYFHLSMQADDDGFVNNPKRIVRTIGVRESDLKKLIQNGFVILFDSGVIVITHWKAHNTIKSDRYTRTQYRGEYAQLELQPNRTYALRSVDQQSDSVKYADSGALNCEACGSDMDPQERKDENRLNQHRKDEEEDNAVCGGIVDLYNAICTSFPKVQSLTNDRIYAIDTLLEKFSVDDCSIVFKKAEASSFLKNHEGGWTVDFDWLMKTENFVKTLEGKYDDKKRCPQDHKLGALELKAIHMNIQ